MAHEKAHMLQLTIHNQAQPQEVVSAQRNTHDPKSTGNKCNAEWPMSDSDLALY